MRPGNDSSSFCSLKDRRRAGLADAEAPVDEPLPVFAAEAGLLSELAGEGEEEDEDEGAEEAEEETESKPAAERRATFLL